MVISFTFLRLYLHYTKIVFRHFNHLFNSDLFYLILYIKKTVMSIETL